MNEEKDLNGTADNGSAENITASDDRELCAPEADQMIQPEGDTGVEAESVDAEQDSVDCGTDDCVDHVADEASNEDLPEESVPQAVVSESEKACVDDPFGAAATKQPSPTRKIWMRVLSCVLCAVMGFFGAVFGIYMLAQTGFVDHNSLLGNLIINSSGMDVHHVTVDETELYYTGGYIELSEKIVRSTVELVELTVDENGEYVTHGFASGVIISEDGYIVTNQHVVDGIAKLLVITHDEGMFMADIVGEDEATDLAVIKAELPSGVKLEPARFGVSSNVRLGQRVLVAGNPIGVGLSVSSGIVSHPSREILVGDGSSTIQSIQTDAAMSRGNSGGGLFDAYGNLIGVICAKTVGDSIEGLGYAVPIDLAKTVINDLLKYGYVTGRPAIGITIAEVLNKTAYDYWVENELKGYLFDYGFGVYIVSSLRTDELKRGDRLIEVDGVTIDSLDDISEALNSHKPGDVITVKVERRSTQPEDGAAYTIVTMQIELWERTW